jgi:hypothetical protein
MCALRVLCVWAGLLFTGNIKYCKLSRRLRYSTFSKSDDYSHLNTLQLMFAYRYPNKFYTFFESSIS